MQKSIFNLFIPYIYLDEEIKNIIKNCINNNKSLKEPDIYNLLIKEKKYKNTKKLKILIHEIYGNEKILKGLFIFHKTYVSVKFFF